MDPQQGDQNTSSPKPQDSVTTELAHITEEIYKKNSQLSQTNRTLSILRKIDETILSSVTDLREVGQQVADAVVVEGDFTLATIYLKDKDKEQLNTLAISNTPLLQSIEFAVSMKLSGIELPLSDDKNFVVKAFKEKTFQITSDLQTVYAPPFASDEIQKMQHLLSAQIVIYPLIVRDSVIGVMSVCLAKNEMELSAYQHELLDRLANMIGIAMDNALLYKQINDANEKLKQLDILKDEFVSLASHELRTPMTAIKSYLWMALDGRGGELSEKLKYYIERSYNSTERLIKLVNEMLNVSRIESGRISLVLSAVDMNKLVDDVIVEVAPRAQESNIVLSVTHSESLPQVEADPDKIREVLINLIGNSLKFTPSGGSITVSFTQENGMVMTQVKDTGKGIDQKDIEHLFQKFGKVDNAYLTAQSVQGTGLGLYICKSIIELHGGHVWAASEGLDKGSAFSFSLKVFTKESVIAPQSGKEAMDLIPTKL